MKYELTFLLNEEKELPVLKELLKSFDVKLLTETTWGKKTLIYPIKKHLTAVFYHWILDVDSKKVSELSKKLNYNETLIRYLLLASE